MMICHYKIDEDNIQQVKYLKSEFCHFPFGQNVMKLYNDFYHRLQHALIGKRQSWMANLSDVILIGGL